SAAVRSRSHRPVDTSAAVLDAERIENTGRFEPAPKVFSSRAQITYTSGSTGLPKGVVASHGNVWSAIETVAAYLGIEHDDRIAGMLPISGVYGANQMLCAVLTGATLVVPKSPLANQIAAE